jgi:molybdopterin synthase sulfur carrier subunit
MKIQVKYFAALREQAGCSEEGFETESKTPAALYHELSALRGLTLDADTLKVAVNNSYASMEQPLEEGDAVVFIPPLAGG